MENLCPKCGTPRQSSDAECTNCGIVYAKLAKGSITRPGDTALQSGRKISPGMILFIALAAVAILFPKLHAATRQPTTPSPTVLSPRRALPRHLRRQTTRMLKASRPPDPPQRSWHNTSNGRMASRLRETSAGIHLPASWPTCRPSAATRRQLPSSPAWPRPNRLCSTAWGVKPTASSC